METQATQDQIGVDYEKEIRNGFFLSKERADETVHARVLELFQLEPSESLTELDREIFAEIGKLLGTNVNVSHHMNDFARGEFALSHQEYDWLAKHSEDQWVDYLIYRYKFKVFPKQKRLLDFPIHVLVEPTSVCNLRCVMCFQVDRSFTTREHMGMMDLDLYKKVVKESADSGAKAITLASRGEPTLHKQFDEMLRFAAECGFMDIKVNTNATRLTEHLSRTILETEVSELVFSVDAGTKETYESIRVKGKFDQVVENIERFHHIRETEFPNAKTVTRISGVKVKDEQDLKQMHDFWSTRVDQVAIKVALPRWDTYNNQPIEVDHACHLLWERAYIWFDGTVNPCDFDYKSKLAVGNVKDHTLKEIWKKNRFSGLRKQHLENHRDQINPCDRCPQ